MDGRLAKISEYCDFTEAEKVYILLMLPRKKDNVDQTERDKLKKRTRYIITNMDDARHALEDFDRYASMYPEVAFRIYLSVNRRSLKKGVFKFAGRINTLMFDLMNGNTQAWTTIARLGSEFKSVLAKKDCRAEKRFMFDVDIPHDEENRFNRFCNYLVSKDIQILYNGTTPNGSVIVTEPFNVNEFHWAQESGSFKDIELKFDAFIYIG